VDLWHGLHCWLRFPRSAHTRPAPLTCEASGRHGAQLFLTAHPTCCPHLPYCTTAILPQHALPTCVKSDRKRSSCSSSSEAGSAGRWAGGQDGASLPVYYVIITAAQLPQRKRQTSGRARGKQAPAALQHKRSRPAQSPVPCAPHPAGCLPPLTLLHVAAGLCCRPKVFIVSLQPPARGAPKARRGAVGRRGHRRPGEERMSAACGTVRTASVSARHIDQQRAGHPGGRAGGRQQMGMERGGHAIRSAHILASKLCRKIPHLRSTAKSAEQMPSISWCRIGTPGADAEPSAAAGCETGMHRRGKVSSRGRLRAARRQRWRQYSGGSQARQPACARLPQK